MLTDAAKEGSKWLDIQNQIIERSRKTLERVQTTYQTKFRDYEEQEVATTSLIKQMKKDKEATEDKVKMGIQRIRFIIGAQ